MLQKEKTAIHHEISLSDEILVNFEEIFTLKLRIKLKKNELPQMNIFSIFLY